MPKAARKKSIALLAQQNTLLRKKLGLKSSLQTDVQMTNNHSLRNGTKGSQNRALERLRQEKKKLTELLQQKLKQLKQEQVNQDKITALTQQLHDTQAQLQSLGVLTSEDEAVISLSITNEELIAAQQELVTLNKQKELIEQTTESLKIQLENNANQTTATLKELMQLYLVDQQKLEQAKQELIEIQEKFEQTHQQLNELTAKKLHADSETTELVKTLLETTTQAQALQEESQQNILAAYCINVALLQALNKQTLEQLATLETQVQQLKEENADIKERDKQIELNQSYIIKNYNDNLAYLASQWVIQDHENTILITENNQLQKELSTSKTSHQTALNRNLQLERTLRIKEKVALAVQLDMRDMSCALDLKTQENEELIAKNNAQQKEIVRLKALLLQSQEKISASENIIAATLTKQDELQIKNDALDKQLNKERIENDNLKQQLDEAHLAHAESESRNENLLLNANKASQHLSATISHQNQLLTQKNNQIDTLEYTLVKSAVAISELTSSSNPNANSNKVLAENGSFFKLPVSGQQVSTHNNTNGGPSTSPIFGNNK